MRGRDSLRWFGSLRAPMSIASFRRLPRHAAYKFEYWDGQLRISPRWQSHGFFLGLRPPGGAPVVDPPEGVRVRLLAADDWDTLPEVLAVAFADAPPLGMLGVRRRLWAACGWLRETREGDEGLLVEPACIVAADRDDPRRVVGALIVTLMPDLARALYQGRRCAVSPPPELAPSPGQPQMSWVFVDPRSAGRGTGTAMLATAAGALWGLGYRELASATHRGNDASMAWHWANGFRLLPRLDSPRGVAPRRAAGDPGQATP